MMKISALSEISTLLITSKLIQQVTSILIEPFNSTEEAEEIWEELTCQLWHISDLNNLPKDQLTTSNLTTPLYTLILFGNIFTQIFIGARNNKNIQIVIFHILASSS